MTAKTISAGAETSFQADKVNSCGAEGGSYATQANWRDVEAIWDGAEGRCPPYGDPV